MLGRQDSTKPRQSIRLEPGEIGTILDGLDAGEAGAPDNRRKTERHRWRGDRLLVFIDEDRRETAYRVPTRNISVGGVSFLHGYMISVGTELRLRFEGLAGPARDVFARVCRCRRVQGPIHEVGVRYVQPAMGPPLLSAVMQAEGAGRPSPVSAVSA